MARSLLLESNSRLCNLLGHARIEPFHRTSSPTVVANVLHNQEQKKPTWRNTQRYSTTSAYSSTSPPALPSCSLSSHPTIRWRAATNIATSSSSNVIICRHAGIATRLGSFCRIWYHGIVLLAGEHCHNHPACEDALKTLGELEAAVCEGVTRFEQDYMGRGPKDIRAHLLGDLLVVRLQGVLTAAEQQLVKALPAEKGRDLLKQVRTHLIETARSLLEAMVEEVTGIKVLSMHHDISTMTGEEVILFTLAELPLLRDARKK